MHLLYVHRGYFPALAGAETMTRRVAHTMLTRGHRVQIMCQSVGGDFERRVVDGIEVLGVPMLDPHILRAVLNPAPDLVHAVDAVWPEYPRAALALAQGWRVPFMITPASIMDTWHDPSATLEVCREAVAVFVLTNTERVHFIQHGVAAERLRVIGQGPELVGQPDPRGWRRRRAITGPMVLFLGRKVYYKGYRLLLAATQEVWAHYPDTTFVFIGPHWDTDCAELFAGYPDRRIIEIDTVDELEKYHALAACDLVCLPSTADVFPLVFVEAWACGKPVIAGPFPGADEIINHGLDGLIAAAAPAAIAEAIVHLLGSPAERAAMGEAGRRRVREELNWEVVASRIESVYQQEATPYRAGGSTL